MKPGGPKADESLPGVGSATVDRRFSCKVAFSEPTAVRVWHEARVLKLLADLPAFDVSEVVAARTIYADGRR